MKIFPICLLIGAVILTFSVKIEIARAGMTCVMEHFPKSKPLSVVATIMEGRQNEDISNVTLPQGFIKIRNSMGDTLSEREFEIHETNTVLSFNTYNDEALSFCIVNTSDHPIVVNLLVKSDEHYEPEENLPTQDSFNVLDSALVSINSLLEQTHDQIEAVDKSLVEAIKNGASFEDKVTYFSSGALVVIGILGVFGTYIIKSEIRKKKQF